MLSFSGSGTRAAAFAYGALEALSQTKIRIDGETIRLLGQVDVVRSFSGGSFTAAYYDRHLFEGRTELAPVS